MLLPYWIAYGANGTTEQHIHPPQDPVAVPSRSTQNDKNAGENTKINAS
jgi:hypothetical protein